MKSKIYLATDHAGFAYKNIVRDVLETEFSEVYEVIDCGAFKHNPTDDYPDFVQKAAWGVSADPQHNKAIIFGGSGEGEAMVANKFPHVRATVYYGNETEIVKLSRQHNDANVLSIGARFVNEELLPEIIRLWLKTEFSGDERHVRRIKKIQNTDINTSPSLISKLLNKL